MNEQEQRNNIQILFNSESQIVWNSLEELKLQKAQLLHCFQIESVKQSQIKTDNARSFLP